MTGVRICVLATGETGTVIDDTPDADGRYVIRLDDGSTRGVDGAERIRLILPDWSLVPPNDSEATT